MPNPVGYEPFEEATWPPFLLDIIYDFVPMFLDARGIARVNPRVLIDFERGVGNPTVRTLRRMFEPFGLELTVRRRSLDADRDEKDDRTARRARRDDDENE